MQRRNIQCSDRRVVGWLVGRNGRTTTCTGTHQTMTASSRLCFRRVRFGCPTSAFSTGACVTPATQVSLIAESPCETNARLNTSKH